MAKQAATPEVATETTAPAGMTKEITVYVVKAGETAVNFPTKGKAKAAHEALKMFGIVSNMETMKKKIAI